MLPEFLPQKTSACYLRKTISSWGGAVLTFLHSNIGCCDCQPQPFTGTWRMSWSQQSAFNLEEGKRALAWTHCCLVGKVAGVFLESCENTLRLTGGPLRREPRRSARRRGRSTNAKGSRTSNTSTDSSDKRLSSTRTAQWRAIRDVKYFWEQD